jgi:hypothetical protein
MSETVVPAIPEVNSGNLLDVARSIKNIIDVREGKLGDPLDANVTFRDLIATGMVKERAGMNYSVRTLVNPVIPNWADDTGYDPTADFNAPPKPVGVVVTSGSNTVKVKWTGATYLNHSYTEVWRGTTNQIGSATLLGKSDTRYYLDDLGHNGTAYYYWVRHVSQADVAGPYNASDGTAPTAGLIDSADIAYLDAAQIVTGYINADRIDVGSLDAKIANIDAAVISSGTIASARIGDATITIAKIAATLQSTNYVANSTGWKISKSGDMELNNATFRGTIDVKSSASGARLEIKNSVMKVYDSGGTLRVKIGDLAA